MKELKEKIIEIANINDLHKIGFAKLEYFEELEAILKKQSKLQFNTSFQVGDIETKVFKNEKVYKTAIVFLMPYQKNEVVLDINKVSVSSSSWGEDYHNVLREKLDNINSLLISHGYNSEVCVDNNGYDEKYLAYKAGLGFFGVNNLLINEDYGSYFFIGIVLTDAVFPYDRQLNKSCLKCMKCVKSCPTGAINESGILNGNKCLSYITQKEELTCSEEKLINQCIYGCDICSQVCPHNKNICKNDNFICDENLIIDVNKYKSLSNREFKNKYGHYAFSWRGKRVFERNVNIYKQKLEKKK